MSVVGAIAGRRRLGGDTIEGIQYLRGIAAMMVVFHHARYHVGSLTAIDVGSRGVEIFFVISGLVMMQATRGATVCDGLGRTDRLSVVWDFLRRRIVRVVPVYWLAILLYVLVYDRAAIRGDWLLLQDVLFIPHWHHTTPDEIWPVLVPGWSLNYEMFFYLVFGLALLAGRGAVWLTCIALVALCGLRWTGASDSATFLFYTRPIMLCFVAGLLLYFPVQWLRTHPHRIPPLWLSGAGMVAGFVGLADWPGVDVSLRLTAMSALIVFSSVFLLEGVRLVPLRVLGDASYSVYLFHIPSFALTDRLLGGLGVTTETNVGASVALTALLTVSAVSGIVAHYAVEKPITRGAASAMGLRKLRLRAPTVA